MQGDDRVISFTSSHAMLLENIAKPFEPKLEEIVSSHREIAEVDKQGEKCH
jgi:hypothetical protein